MTLSLSSVDAVQLYPCEELLGEVVAHWKKRQLRLQKDVKQIRPFIATRYSGRPRSGGAYVEDGPSGRVLRGWNGCLQPG